jgi:hypothetical protein
MGGIMVTLEEYALLVRLYEDPANSVPKEKDRRVIALLNAGYLTDEMIALWADPEEPKLTPRGVKRAKALIKKVEVLRAGVPLEKRVAPEKSGMITDKDPWEKTQYKGRPAFVGGGRGAVIVLGELQGEYLKDCPVSDLDPKKAEAFLKYMENVTSAKRMRRLEPYAYQQEALDSFQLVVLKTKKGDFRVPVQAKFFDYFKIRYPTATYHAVPGLRPVPVAVKAKIPLAKAYGGFIGVILPVSSENWTAPRFEED